MVPLSIHLVNFNSSGPLAECCRRKCCGFDNYQIGFHAESPTEVFKDQKIIYLSPDASNPLIEVEKDVVYVVGGLIDESIEKVRRSEKLPLAILMYKILPKGRILTIFYI